MHEKHVYAALKYIINHSNCRFKDVQQVVGSEDTTKYILGIRHANPNCKYFRVWEAKKGDLDGWSGKYVATLEAVALFHQLDQTRKTQTNLNITRGALMITTFFAAMSIYVNLSGLKLGVIGASIATFAILIIGVIVAFWPAVKKDIIRLIEII